MRDPQRIRPLLVRLMLAWQTCPDLRLGQLISNSSGGAYYIEDEEFIQDIEKYVASVEVRK